MSSSPSDHRTARPDLPPEIPDLAAFAERHPGVAELVRLYERHAETMRQTKAYTMAGTRTVIISTSNASA